MPEVNSFSSADADKIANERFELIARATQDTIWDWDLRTNNLWWNENFTRMFGLPASDIEKNISSWNDRIHPDDRERVLKSIHEVIDGGGSYWHEEYRFRRADGTYAFVYDRGYTIHDEKGPCRMLGSMLDITESIVAQQKLTVSEERLRIALEAAELGTWDFNPATGELDWDHRCRELFGVEGDAPVDYSFFLRGLHPEDVATVDATVAAVFDPKNGGVFDIEYRTIGIDIKKLRWLSARGRALFDEGGKAYRFIGTVLDITEKKIAEDQLQRSEERFKEALIVADTGTWKIDLDAGVIMRDGNLNRILGLKAVETTVPVNESFSYIHHEDVLKIKKALDKAIEEKGDYHEECRMFRTDGSLRWLRDRGRVVVDEKGHAAYIIGAATDITDLKEKEEQIRINEERFRGLFDNASVGMAVADLNGRFTQVNPVMCQITGYSYDELLGRDVISLLDPADHEETKGLMRQLILGEIDFFSIEKKYYRKNGGHVWVHTSVSAVRDENGHARHFVGVIHDIHDKKLAEDSLKLQARVLESMDEGVSVTDENGFILYTNDAEDKIFGYEAGELEGKHVTVQNAYSDEKNEKIVAEVIGQLKTKGFWNGEWHNKKKDGTTFFTYSHITSLHLGERNVLVCVQRDITEEKKTKDALQKSHEGLELMVAERTGALREANERLEKSNEELEQFAYVASHDLQEPLRKIKIFAHRIADELKGQTNERANSFLEKLIGSADRMSTLIRDLLNYSRLTQEKIHFVPVDLNEILRDVLNDFEVLIHQKDARITAAEMPVIKGIPLQLNQLFFNLIGNSLKFSKENTRPEIHISCEKANPEKVRELDLPGEEYYELIFEDNGIGFSPRYREQVFEIFQRLHSKEQFSGTGIGLALSKRVVDNHKGKIIADPVEGKGATFRIYLPVGD